MEETDNRYYFQPKIGLGKILFSDNKERIVDILGKPDEEETDFLNDSDYTIRLFYKNLNYSLHFHFEDHQYNYLSIHLKKIILEKRDISILSQKEILSLLRNYHLKEGLVYEEDYTFDKDVNEECYSFDNIGLTIWFESKKISDICVNPIIG